MKSDSSSNVSDPAREIPATIRFRKVPDTHTPALPDLIEPTSGAHPVYVGDYELLAEIARGGMGVVYKAKQRKLNRIVALKLTRAGRFATPEEVLRLQAEATAAAKLDHPNIVPIYEVGEAAGRRFLSMAFVEGQSLGQVVAGGPLPPRRAAELIKQVAHAVAYAHRQGVIHFDLKPSNILLDAGGQPRVTDFGLAKCIENDSGLTLSGQILGTPSYMSPEQAEAKRDVTGAAADVYSLGATLYCLVTGRPPFQAATPLETVKQVVDREPIAPRQLNPAVDLDLDIICLKCLQKRPDRRYDSALALAEDLQRFLDHRPIHARPVGRVEKLASWCRRNPLVAASLGAAGLIFLVAFALVFWSYLRVEHALGQELKHRIEAQEREKGERWERYRANIVAAASALQQHNVIAARRLLDNAPLQYRNWEWKHLHNQLDLAHYVFSNTTRLATVFIVPGGSRVISDSGPQVRLWDTVSRRQLGTVPSADSQERRISFDGTMYAFAAGHTAVVRYFDGTRAETVFAGHEQIVQSVHFSRDGRYLVTGSDDLTARVWDIRTGKEKTVFRGHKSSVRVLDVSGDGRLVASFEVADFTCRLWDLADGTEVAKLLGHERGVIQGEFNRRGDRLLTVEGFPTNTLRLWDTATGELRTTMRGHTNQVTWSAFSPDGSRLATSGMDQTIRLWDGIDEKPLATLAGHNGRVHMVDFSPDGKQLVSASQDQTIRMWDVATGKTLAVLHGHTGDVFAAAYTADGKTIVSAAGDGSIRLWDSRLVASSGILRGHDNFAYGVAFHPDGERVASAGWDGTVRLWDATTARQLAKMDHTTNSIVGAVAFHPSGNLLASVGRDCGVRLWDVATFEQVQCLPVRAFDWHDPRVAFHPRGTYLASGTLDGEVYLWQAAADLPVVRAWRDPIEPVVLKKQTAAIRDVAFSPDGRWLASASEDRTIVIWDVARKEPVQHLKNHEQWVYTLAWSPQGNWLASGSTDGTVRLWDTTTWNEIANLKHGTNVYSIAFTPDCKRLAAACADNSIRFWDLDKFQEVAELRGHEAYVHSLAFSPRGDRLVSASGDFTVRVWDTISLQKRLNP